LDKVALIEDGIVLVSSGPLHMTIKASEKGVPLTGLARSGANFALEILRQQAESLSVVKQRIVGLSLEKECPEVVNLMISSCQRINDPLLTPLAAVAGAASDMVADYIANYNATKIVVDNGGDIAIRIKGDESVKVGLRLNLARPEFNYTLLVDRDCGICTSGFGGRSFTLGVADGVAVLADNAATADAAATFLANRTTVNSPEIKRVPAESIYPETDIPGSEITHSIGVLNEDEINFALESGKAEAVKLIKKKLIRGWQGRGSQAYKKEIDTWCHVLR
jgi:ApbE superfamily uncharacterized protein (UPF0280 family)